MMVKYADVSYIVVRWMVDNPNDVIYYDGAYWRYEPVSGKFLYRKPCNRKRNGWYEGRGLEASWRHYQKFDNERTLIDIDTMQTEYYMKNGERYVNYYVSILKPSMDALEVVEEVLPFE